MPTACTAVSDDCLDRYALGGLAAGENAHLEEHLLLCADCRQRLAETDRFIAALRGAAAVLDPTAPPVPKPAVVSQTARSRNRFLVLIAAAVILLAFGPALWQRAPQRAVSAAVLLAVRDASPASLPALERSRNTDLTLDLSQTTSPGVLKVKVVNQSGAAVWTGDARPGRGQVLIHVAKPLSAGTYWVRLYNASAPTELIREYGFQVR
jgi:methionine-rich copper-binding protein CopC